MRARLDTGVAQQALMVPQQAVTRDTTGKASALVVGADNKVVRRAIRVDRAVGNRWMVADGLAAGERVIVDGLQRIRAGDVVSPQDVVLKPSVSVGAAAAVAAPASAASTAH